MPIPSAQQSKRDLREPVANRSGSWTPLTTSGAGNGGGTTAVFASLIGKSRDVILGRYFLFTSGTNDTLWRIATDFDPATGTVTFPRALTGQSASGVTAEMHTWRPDLYTYAINEAMVKLYPALYRPILHHQVSWKSGQTMTSRPRNAWKVNRVLQDSRPSRRVGDQFNRDTSATDPGSDWTVTGGQGTWGVASTEELYSVTDVTGDTLIIANNPHVYHGVLQATYRGTLNSGATYRTFALFFRTRVDEDDDIDLDNTLIVRLLNGVVDLRKRDAGTETSLTTASVTTSDGVNYTVRVMFQGTWIRIFVDDQELITYELTGLNTKYLDFGHAAVRLVTAGAPATAARLDDYALFELVGTDEIGDVGQSYDGRGVELSARGNSYSTNPSTLIWFECMAPLTALAADTFETLTTDSTDLVEIEATDPARDTLIDWAVWSLYKQASQPGNTLDAEDRQRAAAALPDAERTAMASFDRHTMDQPKKLVRGLGW